VGQVTALQPCGTHAAYQRHRRAGETPCEKCKNGNAVYMRMLRAGNEAVRDNSRKNTRAHNRAKQRLADLHPDEYAALLLEEKQKGWTA